MRFFYLAFIILFFILSCSDRIKTVEINDHIKLKVLNNTKIDSIEGIDNVSYKLNDERYGGFIIESGFYTSSLVSKKVKLVPFGYGAKKMNQYSVYEHYVEVEKRKNKHIYDPDYYQETNFEIDTTTFNSPVKWVFPNKKKEGFNGVFFYRIYQSETLGNYKLKIYTDNGNNLTSREFQEFIKKTVVIKKVPNENPRRLTFEP